MKGSKRSLTVLILLLCLTFAFTASAGAAPVVLKLSHQWATSDIRAFWAVKWAEMVADKSKGQIKVEIYPASSLFKPAMQYDALRAGSLDACLMVTSYLDGKMPQVGVAGLPTIIKNEKEGLAWGHSPIGEKLNELSKKNGFEILSWAYLTGSVGAKGKAVVRPEDLNGLKARGAGKYYESMMREAGASITSMPSSEVYFACQTGVLDGLITTYSSFVSFRLYEVIDNLSSSDGYDIYGGHVWLLVSNSTLKKLDPAQREILVQAGQEVEPLVLEKLLEAKADCVKTFQDKGVKISNITKEDFEVWRKVAMKSAYEMFRQKVKDADDWLKLADQVNVQ